MSERVKVKVFNPRVDSDDVGDWEVQVTVNDFDTAQEVSENDKVLVCAELVDPETDTLKSWKYFMAGQQVGENTMRAAVDFGINCMYAQ